MTDLRLSHRYQKRGERIRELEAELEGIDEALNFSFLPGQTRQSIIASIRAAAVDHANQKARAEKAEAKAKHCDDYHTHLTVRLQAAEARIAELEARE